MQLQNIIYKPNEGTYIQNMGKSDHLFILGLILSNGWSTLHLRMVFIVWHVYYLVTPPLIKIALNLRYW